MLVLPITNYDSCTTVLTWYVQYTTVMSQLSCP